MQPRRTRRTVVLVQTAVLTAVILVVPPSSAQLVPAALTGGLVNSIGWGWTEGRFAVSDDGAATYTIPLWVPKGRGELQPELSLAYRSGGGNGLLGVGWSIGGFSAIAPCPRTLAHDGTRARVTFSADDAYCLDGTRLRPAGSPAAGQREYRTERDPFARVIGYGSAGVPDYFRVWTRDGKVLSFGAPNSLAGRLVAYQLRAGPDVQRPSLLRSLERVTASWHLTRIEDRNGNSATVNYQRIESSANLWSAELRPTSIVYSPNRSVRFSYEARPDPIDGFSAGVHTRTGGRVSRIAMYAGATGETSQLLREYRLSYQNGSVTGRSRLREIRECDHNGVCRKPLQLTWSLGGHEFDVIDTNVTDVGTGWSDDPPPATAGRRLITGDIDGDGRDDLLYPDEQFTWRIRRSSGSGFTTSTPAGIPRVEYGYRAGMRPIDVDNDGKLDVMAEARDDAGQTDWYLYRSTGSAFALQPPGDLEPGHTTYDNEEPVYFADLDGNGAADYAALTHDGDKVRYRLNTGATGTGRFQSPVYTAEVVHPTVGTYSVDSDGDGRVELLGLSEQQAPYRYKTVGLGVDGALVTRWPNLPTQANLTGLHFADVNGDGLADVVYTHRWGTDALTVQLNTGNGFSPLIVATTEYRAPATSNGQFEPYDMGVRIVDFDNDGRQDVVVVHGGTPTGPSDFQHGLQAYVWRDGRFARLPLDRPAGEWTGYGFPTAQTLDVDGNGVLDVVHQEGDHLRILKRRQGRPDQLVGVAIGDVGPRVEVEYATLSRAAFAHLPGSCSYPAACLTEGGSVVREHREYHGDGWNVFVHSYEGARADVTGRGWLGFAKHTVVDLRLGSITETEFDNVTRVPGTVDLYPYAFLPRRRTHTLHVDADTEYQRTVTSAFALRRLGTPGTHTVELRSSVDAERERPVGAAAWQDVRVSTTQLAHDAFGNPLLVDSSVAGGRRTAERMEYRNDESTWLIGRLVRRQTTGCLADGTTCLTRESTMDYDEQGNLARTTVEPTDPALLRRTTIARTEHGNVRSIRVSDAAGAARIERLRYDADDLHVVATTNAAGHTTGTRNHSGLGVPLESTDPNGVVTAMRYDWFGRLRETNYANGDFEHIQHQFFFGAHALFTRTGSGGLTITLLDALGRETSVIEEAFGGGNTATETRYDPLGRVSAYSRPTRIGDPVPFTTLGYDRLGRQVSETAPDGVVVRTEYRGRETHTYDAKGVHSYRVDTPDGDVAARYEDDPRSTAWLVTGFEYGPFGELTRTVAADGTAATLGYDRLGRRIRHTDPSAGTTVSEYNAFDEQVATTLGDGQQITSDYDAIGRLTRRWSADGVATYTWDTAPGGVGRLATATSADGVVTRYGYDPLGRNTGTAWLIGGDEYEIGRSYDDVGRLATVTYPAVPDAGRLEVSYVYDATGRVHQVRNARNGTLYWQAEAINAAGQLERERFGNDVVTTRSYDPRTALPQGILTQGPGTVGTLDEIEYRHDVNRNLSQRNDKTAFRWEIFEHDTLNRLTTWRSVISGPGQILWNMTFAYDSVGNLAEEVVHGSPDRSTVYRYGERGAGPHALTSRGDDQYSYDAIGRQTGGVGRTVRYTGAGLPAAITTGPGQRTEFGYDADGLRVFKRDRVETTVTVPGFYDRRTAADVQHVHHIVVDGTPVAQVVRVQDSPNGPVVATRVAYLHTDPQGSVVQVTGAGGRPVENLYYDPFGRRVNAAYRPLADERRADPRLGYTGHASDDELGLVDMKGRVYDPAARRFLTPDPVLTDPLSSQGHNRYSYVRNNPTTLTDPTGLWPDDEPDPWGPPEPEVDPEADPDAWIDWTSEWTQFAESLDAGESAPSSDDDTTAERAWQARPEVIVITGRRPNDVERDEDTAGAAVGTGPVDMAPRRDPVRAGGGISGSDADPPVALVAAAAPASGTLTKLYHWINKRLGGRLLATYLDAKGGSVTVVNEVTEYVTKAQGTERTVSKARTPNKTTVRAKPAPGPKPTKVRGGFGFGWSAVLGLFGDLDVWIRAGESGRSFDEQLREDSKDAKYVVPLGIPLPLPNPYYREEA